MFNLQKEINSTKFINENFPQYHHDILMSLHKEFNLTGKTVLDVGGSNFPEKLMHELGVKQFICIDPVSQWLQHHNVGAVSLYNEKKVISINQIADHLTSEYCFIVDSDVEQLDHMFHNYFDITLSISTFEHVKSIQDTLTNVYNFLKPGGLLHSQYEPVFTSRVGHHCYVNSNINFNNTKELDNIHLLYLKDDAKKYLQNVRPDISGEMLDKVLFQVYESDIINRKTFNQHILEIANSPFNSYSVNYFSRMPLDEALVTEFEQKFGPMRYDVRGILLRCYKD